MGFPTCLPFIDQIPDDMLVTASEATPEEQYQWLKLLEQHWLGPDKRNNQISYTLKYDSSTTTYQGFMDMLLTHQPHVRCCSVMRWRPVLPFWLAGNSMTPFGVRSRPLRPG